jgi:hypothetical protein
MVWVIQGEKVEFGVYAEAMYTRQMLNRAMFEHCLLYLVQSVCDSTAELRRSVRSELENLVKRAYVKC